MSWRDQWSRDAFNKGTVYPDWAFSLGAANFESTKERSFIAVSMRGDRPFPDDHWFDDVDELSREHGAKILLVVQVRRDSERARQLASRLGASVLMWPVDTDHASQEGLLRDVYSRSIAVISDRIHALILGFTEGAVPLGWDTVGSPKIDRTFAPVTCLPVSPSNAADRLTSWRLLLASRSQFAADRERTRLQFDALREAIWRAVQDN